MAATAASSYEYIVRRQRPGQKGETKWRRGGKFNDFLK